MNVNERLAKLAAEQGATQYGLSKETGLSQPYIGRIMKGDKSPPVETLEKLCAALGITLAEFFAEDSPADPHESRLLAAYRKLPKDKQDTVLTMIEAL